MGAENLRNCLAALDVQVEDVQAPVAGQAAPIASDLLEASSFEPKSLPKKLRGKTR
jgi:hypothetical protein